MPDVSHVLMHLTLCASMAHAPAGTPMQLSLHAQDRTGRLTFERQFTATRGTTENETIEFDAPYGTYRAAITAPKYNCSAGDYFIFRPPHMRNIKETLVSGPPRFPRPTILFGAAPQSFISAQPTFVALDSRTKCDEAIQQTAASDVPVEYDPDSFFVNLTNASDPPNSKLLALHLQTSTGEDQYVSLKTTFPYPWGGWPSSYEVDLNDAFFAGIATMKTDVLLCPKLYKTSSG